MWYIQYILNITKYEGFDDVIMTIFIPVDYNGKKYPAGISCEVKEIAGHFDNISIPDIERYSLHTEILSPKGNSIQS